MDSKVIDKMINAAESENIEQLIILMVESIRSSNLLSRMNIYSDRREFFYKNEYAIIEHWVKQITDDNIKYILSKLNQNNIGAINLLRYKTSSNIYILEKVWEKANPELQKERIVEIINSSKFDSNLLETIWFYTCAEAKKVGIEEVIDIVKGNSELLKEIWQDTKEEVRLMYFGSICSILKKEDMEKYKEFVYEYVGEIEFDKYNNPEIPQDLKEIIFNKKYLEQSNKNNKKILHDLEKNLPDIIRNWNLIRKNIQYKKANSIINDDIEVRTNIETLMSAYKAINTVTPKTIAQQEFESTRGAEIVGNTSKYTHKPEEARQRAYNIAEEMDKSGRLKKYPDFSIEDDEIVLKVFHPYDKRAILLGYNTDCCFRPNGNADNFGEDPYSLFIYALTTPYGGVLECGKRNRDNTEFLEVYMGTPFLVNGNCMTFHSYETKNGKEGEKVNKLLVEAAKKAIEKSNGSINAVMITNLHTGEGRLDTYDKFNLGPFFKVYTEEKYSKFTNMKANLNNPNFILAVRLGDKILTGEELNKWCKETCKGDAEIIKQKLGLKFGKIEKNYEFPEREAIIFEKKIENPQLVKVFKKEYDKLREERVILSYIKRKRKLDDKKLKEGLNLKEEKMLQECNEKILNLEENTLLKISNLSQVELKKRLEENSQKTFEIYSGKDLKLIANSYGITDIKLKDIVEKAAQEKAKKEIAENEKKTKELNDKQKTKTGKHKKEKGKLIGEVKRKMFLNSKDIINKIQKDLLTKEDFKILDEAGIDTKAYRESIEREINIIDNESRKKVKIQQRVRKYIKDEEFIKSVIMSEIVEEPSDELIKKETLKKANLTIRNKLKEEVTKNIKRNRIEGLEIDQELDEWELIKRNNEIRDRVIDLDSILLSISSGKKLSDDKKNAVDKLKIDYDIDVEKIYNEIAESKEKIKSDVIRRKFEKIQSSITLGIENKEAIGIIIGNIKSEETKTEDYDNLTYGKSWYIATGDQNQLDIYLDENAKEQDKEKMKKKIEQMIDNTQDEVEKKCLEARYQELFNISMDSIGICTEEISKKETDEELKELRETAKGENNQSNIKFH